MTDTDLTEITKKPYLDQNKKGGSGNKFESLQVESGPDGQSGLQIQYVPKSTGNLDLDESKHIYESPMKTHSDKNLSSKATPKAIIDASDESSDEDENLKSKVVQKRRDSEPPHEGLGISLNDMIEKDIKRRSSLEQVGPNGNFFC
jgi:hypothetical protein